MSNQKPSRLPHWLVGSLVVNALLVGLLIGGGLANRKHPQTRHPGGEYGLARGIEQAIPETERRAVRRAFRQASRGSRQQRLSMMLARGELSEILAREPYDREAVLEAFAQIRTAGNESRSRLHEELATVLGTLTAEQRRAIINDLERGRPVRLRLLHDRRPPPPE